MTELTRTTETEANYTKTALARLNAYRAETGKEDINYLEFTKWVCNKKPEYQRSTWMVYKNSIVFYLKKIGETEASEHLKATSSEGCKKSKKNDTSAYGATKKQKRVDEEKFKAVQHHLLTKSKHSMTSAAALIFISASALVGLRPSEWFRAELLVGDDSFLPGNPPILKVANAKSTNGRAHGQYRHFDLSEFTERDIMIIDRLVNIILNHDHLDGYRTTEGKQVDEKRFLNCIRSAISQACRVTSRDKPNFSLYSFRHQVVANCKKAGYSRKEIAALFGHSTDATASKHYARASAGNEHRPSLPRAIESEVALIKEVSIDQSFAPNVYT